MMFNLWKDEVGMGFTLIHLLVRIEAVNTLI